MLKLRGSVIFLPPGKNTIRAVLRCKYFTYQSIAAGIVSPMSSAAKGASFKPVRLVTAETYFLIYMKDLFQNLCNLIALWGIKELQNG